MGFLDWWKENPDVADPSTGDQLSLWGESENLPERRRISGLTIRKRFNAAIARHGGDSDGQAAATEVLTEEVLDRSTKELYQQTGAKKKQRETLPELAQEALAAGETIAAHQLNSSPEFQGDQMKRNNQIVETTRDASRGLRRLLPW